MTNAEPTDKAAAVAEHGGTNAPEPIDSKKRPSKKKGAPKGQKPAKGAKTKAEDQKKQAKAGKKASKQANASSKAKEKPTARRSNKKTEVIGMMKRAKGATLAEIMVATGWQKHTVRGFVSILGKNGGEKIESSKNPSGQRTYKITK